MSSFWLVFGEGCPIMKVSKKEAYFMSNKNVKNDKKGLEIMIVGCGKVGQTLAEQLNEDGNNITVKWRNFNLTTL